MRVRAPDIYIIGAQKSGTTTLFDWIAQHPEIYAHPLAKDYPYFSFDRTYREGRNIFYSFSGEALGHQLVLGGDANTMYSQSGPERMHKIMPSARLILILRNPVDRVFSAYCHAFERLLENRSLEQAINDELTGLKYKPEDALRRDYLAHGQYARQLNKVYHVFNPEQVNVVIFEKFKEKPLEILSDLFQFIGVSENFVPKMEVKNQTKGGSRSKFLAKLIHRCPSSKLIRSLARTVIPFSLRTNIRRKLVAINRIEQPKPEFLEQTRQVLVDYYRGEIAELESLVRCEILLWHE